VIVATNRQHERHYKETIINYVNRVIFILLVVHLAMLLVAQTVQR